MASGAGGGVVAVDVDDVVDSYVAHRHTYAHADSYARSENVYHVLDALFARYLMARTSEICVWEQEGATERARERQRERLRERRGGRGGMERGGWKLGE